MPFRVALSADFLTADGSPAYPMFDLSPLDAAGVEYEYVDLVESAAGMTGSSKRTGSTPPRASRMMAQQASGKSAPSRQ